MLQNYITYEDILKWWMRLQINIMQKLNFQLKLNCKTYWTDKIDTQQKRALLVTSSAFNINSIFLKWSEVIFKNIC